MEKNVAYFLAFMKFQSGPLGPHTTIQSMSQLLTLEP